MALSQLQTISISRGDTKEISISITSGSLGVNDKIVFSFGSIGTNGNYTPLVTKTVTSTDLSFTITHQDSLQKVGNYYYDFRVIRDDGTITTLCLPSNFIILGVVANV
jgi:hypothetical protein